MSVSYPMRVPSAVHEHLLDVKYVYEKESIGEAMALVLDLLFKADPDFKQRCETARKAKK